MASGAKVLVGLGLIGGAAYLWNEKRKKDENQQPAMPGEMPDYTPGVERIVPPGWDEMVALYQSIIYGQGSLADCQKLLTYIGELHGENAEEDAWIEARKLEVIEACKAQYPDQPVPQLPSWAAYLQDALTRCWTTNCSSTEVTNLLRQLDGVASQFAGMVPNDQVMTVRNASSALNERYLQLAGVQGTHVGNCGCEECQEKVGKTCCAECAMGVGACSCEKKEPQQVSGKA